MPPEHPACFAGVTLRSIELPRWRWLLPLLPLLPLALLLPLPLPLALPLPPPTQPNAAASTPLTSVDVAAGF